jgi:SNF2 family DNA or RNA helicase
MSHEKSSDEKSSHTPLWEGFAYKPHQEYGVSWLLKREEGPIRGGLLCDEMGLGKTIQMLGLIKESSAQSTLLIAPLAVINQWKDTAERCKIRCFTYNSKSKTWELKTKPFSNSKSLYLIGYECLANNIKHVEQKVFDRVVCDEAHRLGVKSIAAKLTKGVIEKIAFNTVRRITKNATSKWFLTATPVVNSVDDIYSLFALLDKSLVTEVIETLMGTYALARSMEQLRTSIPDAPNAPLIKNHRLDFASRDEEEFYTKIQSNVEAQLRYNEKTFIVLRLILMLRQLSIHPQIYIEARKKKVRGVYEDWLEPSTKFLKIKELMTEESHENHKWIIFCHFHEEMDLLEKYLKTLDFVRHIETYSGSLDMTEKADALKKVREPFVQGGGTCDILLCQLKAGGVGLNLQEFDRIVFNGPWWTQAAIDQGIGRAVRIGQKNQVVVHNLVLKQEESVNVRNIDVWMRAKAEEKEAENRMALDMADSNLV